jgi:flagellar motor component MotA
MMKRLFKVLFFACGWIGLLLNLIFVLVSFAREEAVETSTFVSMVELLWIGGCTFFGLGALIVEDPHQGPERHE